MPFLLVIYKSWQHLEGNRTFFFVLSFPFLAHVSTVNNWTCLHSSAALEMSIQIGTSAATFTSCSVTIMPLFSVHCPGQDVKLSATLSLSNYVYILLICVECQRVTQHMPCVMNMNQTIIEES